MAECPAADFLAGVIEGFYGQPWSQAERFQLFDWMSDWGLNTYLYAPKDDLKHRTVWRELYTAAEAESISELIQGCRRRNIRFIYALSPGLDIRYASEADLRQLQNRFDQMLSLGCQHFALLFDDIPDRMDPEDLTQSGSLAAAQCRVANALLTWTRERSPEARFLFCPTPYCGRMAERTLGGEDYLAIVGRELLPEIDVFWTGPEIISREITVAHVAELRSVLRRKPLIWDNLHANDYDGRRFYCGPYSGRPPELRNAVAGLLINPNNEFPLNYVPIRTLAQFVQSTGEWNPRDAYLEAMQEWHLRISTVGEPVTLEDLILFGDCYYLPHQEGPGAEVLYDQAKRLLTGTSENWHEQAEVFRREAARLREMCVRLAALRDRPLFYALSRRIWELREEMDLLERYVGFLSEGANSADRCEFDFPQPGTYRGGMVARLQALLIQQPDGTLIPAKQSVAANPTSIPQ